MSRYIDADVLIQALCADNDGIGRADAKAVMTCLEDVFSIVEDAPTIDIVRCKECKFLMKDGHCYEFADDYIKVKPDDFCSYGERKEQTE